MMLNESLRILRLYFDKSQAEMAKILGISQPYLSEIERGHKDVTLDLLKEYSNHLNVPLSSLLFFAESLNGAPPPTRGRVLVANKVLKLLQKLVPEDVDASNG